MHSLRRKVLIFFVSYKNHICCQIFQVLSLLLLILLNVVKLYWLKCFKMNLAHWNLIRHMYMMYYLFVLQHYHVLYVVLNPIYTSYGYNIDIVDNRRYVVLHHGPSQWQMLWNTQFLQYSVNGESHRIERLKTHTIIRITMTNAVNVQ